MSGIFVDTGAWFARFVPTDPDHPAAKVWLDGNTSPLITTDYIVDELLTLLKVRGEYQRALEIGPNLFGAAVCDLEWVTPADVDKAWQVFSELSRQGVELHRLRQPRGDAAAGHHDRFCFRQAFPGVRHRHRRAAAATSGSVAASTWSRTYDRPDLRGLLISSSGFTDQGIRDLSSIQPQRLVLCQLQEIVLLLEEGRDLKGLLRTRLYTAETEQKALASNPKS